MDIKEEIGKRIKETRRSRGLNQQELAILLDKSQGTVSAMEKGKSILVEDIYLLCRELNISADWLILGNKEIHFIDDEIDFLLKYSNLSDREKGRIDEILDRSKRPEEIKKIGNL